MFLLFFGRFMFYRNCLFEIVFWFVGFDIRLEFQFFQSGILLMVWIFLEGGFFCFLFKLCRKGLKLILGNSEVLQGFFVQVQVVCIFIDMFILLSFFLRQCLDCYVFCVGWNLFDKEFCYFRIVIVMVVVYWGFGCWFFCYQVINFFDFLVLGRCQFLYMVL